MFPHLAGEQSKIVNFQFTKMINLTIILGLIRISLTFRQEGITKPFHLQGFSPAIGGRYQGEQLNLSTAFLKAHSNLQFEHS